ncbi:hypothetical protein [Pseudoxanthomonas koreensis]|uniref:hypothetical protein n=1 Tax=Pseudoxanthomonas koreensis TaxID=266061 RepID=UPI001391924E|nr:hypothetical protein [Pseudoxanthomonas koreensis]KAF1694564.1 hypothetical protein CSC64_03895 [Pseudoxanthomonas koreensis]
MYVIEIVLFVIGLVLLVMGYRRNHRNLMLCAAITLFLSAGLGPMVEGFSEGYRDSRAAR